MSGRTAILAVNGFSPRTPEMIEDAIRYPWIGLCLREIARRSQGSDYEVHVWDNSRLAEHESLLADANRIRVWRSEEGGSEWHPEALDALVARTGDDVEYIVLLDTDAIPVADGWLETMSGHLEAGAALVGVWRDEMAPDVPPFVHVSCLCIRREELLSSGVRFGDEVTVLPGPDLTEELERRNRPIVGLHRSNAVNLHFLIGGVYGDIVYHHGAGSRPARFISSTDFDDDERVRVAVRNAAFRDFDHLIAVLRGQVPNDIIAPGGHA